MKPYQYQNSNSSSSTSTTSSTSVPKANQMSNSEMQEMLRGGQQLPNTTSNAERIQLLEQADTTTDILGLVKTNPFNAINAGVNGMKGYEESPCTTETGKVVDGLLDGTFNFLLGSNMVTNAGDIILPEGYKISEMTDSASSALTSMMEAVITGETTALENYTQKVETGEYGIAPQTGIKAQQYWEEQGVVQGVKNVGDELIDLLK